MITKKVKNKVLTIYTNIKDKKKLEFIKKIYPKAKILDMNEEDKKKVE